MTKVGISLISVEPVSGLDYCQIGMTAIVMRDVNAVYTLECAHRRQLLAARALHERSLLISGLPFPRTKTIGDVHIDDQACILSVLQFSSVHPVSSPIEVQRADALYDFLQIPTNAGKSGSTHSGELWGGRLDGVAGTLGFPLERRVSLMLVTMLMAAMGVNRTPTRRLLGGWRLPSRFDEMYLPSLMCLTLQPPHCRQAVDSV